MFDAEFFALGRLDRLSYQDTVIHRLDPRVKLLITLAFIVAVVSFPKYAISGLTPFFIFPVLVMTLGDIPVGFILKKIVAVAPFAIFVGIFNPLLDSGPGVHMGGVEISSGWISFGSIMLKFMLTISAALLVVATTSFPGICHALERLGAPRMFVSQLMFLYRFIFILGEEAMRMVRARDLRAFGALRIKDVIPLLGVLFIRTVDRSERVYQAMLARGFDGTVRINRTLALRTTDMLLLAASIALIALFRAVNITAMLDGLFLRGYA